MKNFLTVMQVLVSISMIGLVLLQAKGAGLGGSLSNVGYRSKRGTEKVVFLATIILGLVFLLVSIANFVL
jgi:preprotein translocase subunit SecG